MKGLANNRAPVSLRRMTPTVDFTASQLISLVITNIDEPIYSANPVAVNSHTSSIKICQSTDIISVYTCQYFPSEGNNHHRFQIIKRTTHIYIFLVMTIHGLTLQMNNHTIDQSI